MTEITPPCDANDGPLINLESNESPAEGPRPPGQLGMRFRIFAGPIFDHVADSKRHSGFGSLA